MIKRNKARWNKDALTSFAFVIPALILFSIFNIYTFFDLLRLSFMHSNNLPNNPEIYVGFKNYIDIFFHDREWWTSVGNAAMITFLALTLQNFVALVLALFVDSGLRGQTTYKVIFFLPPILSGIVVGLIWDIILDAGNTGLLNHWLEALNLGEFQRAWLSEKETALYSVAFIHMWKGFGWGFVILLAGLQSIDPELYEAADADGANWWPKFCNITVPLMIPVFVIVSILTILGTMQIYDLIVSTTGGGPGIHTEVPITQILDSMLTDYGVASAQGIVFGVMLLLVSLVQIKISNRLKHE